VDKKQQLDRYLSGGYKNIGGWASPVAMDIMRVVADTQREQGITGNLCEIGVFHGRSAIALALEANNDEVLIAIDLFELQEENIDDSGEGDLGQFKRNMLHWVGSMDNVRPLSANSTKISAEDISDLSGNHHQVRLFSVDGGHTKEITLNDIKLAVASLSEHGVLLIDDVYNEGWPEVAEALYTYLAEHPGTLFPFAVAGSKVFLANTERSQKIYLAALDRITDSYVTQTFVLAGCPVIRMRALSSTDKLRNTSLWRSLRSTPIGRLVKRLRLPLY